MDLIPILSNELGQEAETTRKFLKLVPPEKFDWKPHKKSMSLKSLSIHIAELPGWVEMALSTDELDFAANEYEPTPVNKIEELQELFETSYKKGKVALQQASEEELLPEWTMRMGDKVLVVWKKHEVIRHSFNQTTHHRAQLGVYFRLLDIPVPGSYGPSADEESFK